MFRGPEYKNVFATRSSPLISKPAVLAYPLIGEALAKEI
jgi:hypothetical protein